MVDPQPAGRSAAYRSPAQASHCIADVGKEPLMRAGDIATIFDWEDGSRPEDLAAGFGGSVYDLLMHMSPLLPRRIL